MNFNIIGITDTKDTITLEDAGGNKLITGVPIYRILLCVMACCNKNNAELAALASTLARVEIGADGKLGGK